MNELMKSVAQRVEECFVQAEIFYGRKFKRPDIGFRTMNGTSAGRAKYSGQLVFNPALLRENVDEYMKQVIPHEVAHIVAVEVYGAEGKGHGSRWQSVMKNCYGLSPGQYHEMDTTNSNQANAGKFRYTCDCGLVHMLSQMKHSQIQMKRTFYLCGKCKSGLTYVK